jgi:hypothetical protein
MQYKVVPFVAALSQDDGASVAANQLESLTNELAQEGWEYVSLEQVETYIAGSDGCFGFGSTPGKTTSVSMAVFRK